MKYLPNGCQENAGSMDELDPKAIRYQKSRRERRKADDPSYRGPERRLGRRRKEELLKILSRLQRESKS
jgi:hypothetical protein